MDEQQLSEFVAGDYARVVAVVGFACGDPALAEDAVQEALSKLIERDLRVDDLGGWVVVAALNQIRSTHRRRQSERKALARLAQARRDAEAVTSSRTDGLLDAMRELPMRQREIVAMHYLLDTSVAEIASLLGVAEGTVKTHLHRARTSLRRRLEQQTTATPSDDMEGDNVHR